MAEMALRDSEEMLMEELQTRLHECPETDEGEVRRNLRMLYRSRHHPKPNVPVLFVDSPVAAIAEATKIYRQSMHKVEDGFMLKLVLPDSDPILVKSGVQYPTFLKWDFASALFRTNSYVKADIWGYSRMRTRDNESLENIRQITRDVVRLVDVHISRWRRYSEAEQYIETFRKNTGYWPIARNAAFGRGRQFPGCLVVRLMTAPSQEYPELPNTVRDLAKLTFLTYVYDDFAIVVNFPKAIHMDGEGRLGRMGGPAIEWRDGTGTYALNGRMIPKTIGTGTLTFKKILSQNNAEVKRVLVSHFGEDKFLKLIGAKATVTDDYGTLYMTEDPIQGERERFAMVAVKNSTQEPDGTYKTYYLRVSPRVTTPHQAIAESFRIGTEGFNDWRLSQVIKNSERVKYNPYKES